MLSVINKSFTFDAAHQLPNHSGKCSRLHGHTYKAEITVVGDIHPADGRSSEGMVVDFDVVSQVYNQYIKETVDHRFLIPIKNPSVSVIARVGMTDVQLGDSHYTLPNDNVALLPIENTTAEWLSRWILDTMHYHILETAAVRVYETPTSYAEASYGGE